MSAPADLPGITKIDTEISETGETPGVRVWFDNGAKVQVVEDDVGSLERQWFEPDHWGEPMETEVLGDATAPDASLAKAGLETVSEYLEFEDPADAREGWGDEHVDVLLGE